MTSCPSEYQSGESGHQRPRATTTGVLPPATRLVRTVRGRDANSRPSPEIGKGDPSKCCTGVQTSRNARGAISPQIAGSRPSHMAQRTPSPERPRPGFQGGVVNSRIFRQLWRDAQPGRYSDRGIAALRRCSASTIPPMGRIARCLQSTHSTVEPRGGPCPGGAPSHVDPQAEITRPDRAPPRRRRHRRGIRRSPWPGTRPARPRLGPAGCSWSAASRPARETRAGRGDHGSCTEPGVRACSLRVAWGRVPIGDAARTARAGSGSMRRASHRRAMAISAPSPWRRAMAPAGSSSTRTTNSPPPRSASGRST